MWADSLDRAQAIAMLKELIENDLVEPSYVNICERLPNHYQIQIKCDYNKQQIETYAKKHGLIIEEDKDQKYCLIFKP